MDVVDGLQAAPSDLLRDRWRGDASEFASRLSAEREARDAFLQADVGVEQKSDVVEMIVRVREPLLSVIRLSSDFEPTYGPRLGMALLLHEKDPEGARNMPIDLEKASSERTEARLLRRRLFGD